jgi:hypothetical protein
LLNLIGPKLTRDPTQIPFKHEPKPSLISAWPSSPFSTRLAHLLTLIRGPSCTVTVRGPAGLPAQYARALMEHVSQLRKRISRNPHSLHECVLHRKSATSARPISAGPATTPHPALACDQPKLQAHQPSAPSSLPEHRGPSAFVLLRLSGQAEPRRFSVCDAAPEVPCPPPSVQDPPFFHH